MKIDEKTKQKMSRFAQLIANSVVSAKRKANPDMTKEELNKLKGQALATASRFLGPYMIVHATEAKFFKEEFINMAFDNIHDDDLEDLLENNYI